MKIAGIDLGSRKIAMVTLMISAQEELYLTNAVSFHVHPSMRGLELGLLAEAANRVAREEGWNYAFVEEPLVGRGVKASMQVSQVAGSVLSALSKTHTRTELVNVKTWKKQIIGNGNAAKHDVSSWLEERFPGYAEECAEDQDLKDACCVALFGVKTVRNSQFLEVSGLASEPEG